MKQLYFLNPPDAPQGSGFEQAPDEQQPSGDSQAAPQGGFEPGNDEIFDRGDSLMNILSNAPIVGGEADADGQPDDPEPQAKADPQFAVVDLSSPDKPVKIRVDEETELDRDALLAALKDHRDKQNWVARHTQESQLMNFYHKRLSPEERDRFLAWGIQVALGKQPLPEDAKPEPIELPVELEYQSEYDDEPVKVKGKRRIDPDSEEYGTLKEHFYKQFMKEHEPVFREIKDFRETREQFEQQVQQWQEQAADQELKSFVKQNGYNIPTDGNIRQKLEEILSAGETHPYYRDTQRLLAVAQVAQSQGIGLAEAHELLYGESEKKAKAVQQQRKDKQKQSRNPLRPGIGNVPVSDTDRFIDALNDPGAAASADLWSGKL